MAGKVISAFATAEKWQEVGGMIGRREEIEACAKPLETSCPEEESGSTHHSDAGTHPELVPKGA